ncbi:MULTISPECIES: hypothetical protein [Actinomadura]|uniref:DUF11 domain-containing protein n=1 Tax=Actinomadura yumaensis TaxID=111807 RepID=A0ABW2CKU4_9ACTN|nr:hypothetical protein [Actinomadura sp. J1-007]
MLYRSAVRPIFAGLGTAAILAAGAAPAFAVGDPSPSPSVTATKTEVPAAPELVVYLAPSDAVAKPGQTVSVPVQFRAVSGIAKDVRIRRITTSPASAFLDGECETPFGGTGCKVGDLDPAGKRRDHINLRVRLPESLKKTTNVTVTVSVASSNVEPISDSATIQYVVKKKPKPSSSPSSGKDGGLSGGKGSGSGSGSGSNSGSGSGSGGSGSGSGSGSSNGGSSFDPPKPNGTFNQPNATQSPQVALPPIAPPSPSVAASATTPPPESRLRNNKAPVAQDLTFERMASTQVAWLAALLVAFSLLLTQLRLGRRNPAASAAAAEAARRAKGTHRRPRRGVFGK